VETTWSLDPATLVLATSTLVLRVSRAVCVDTRMTAAPGGSKTDAMPTVSSTGDNKDVADRRRA
jgi:hypothetical protein